MINMLFKNDLNLKLYDKLVLLILVVLTSGASVILDNDFLLLIIFFFLVAGFTFRRRTFDPFIGAIILVWFIINLISYSVQGTVLNWNLFFGVIVKFMIPYLGIKIIGSNFWQNFEHIIFRLTIICIPLFLLDTVFPSFFNSLVTVFRPITSEVFYEKAIQENYWYGFFYTNSGRDDFRNSGFMWEPGAFAMIIIIAIIYNWITKGVFINKRILLYFIGLITTFSTAGFISLAILLMVFFLNSRKFHVKLFSLLTIILILIYFGGLEFMAPKIQQSIEAAEKGRVYEQGYGDRLEVNRLSYFMINFRKSLELISGYGIVPDTDTYLSHQKIVGVNGLGDILLMWGWVGLTFVIVSLHKFINFFSSIKFKKTLGVLLLTSLLVVFFSNPIERNPILFLLIFSPYIIRNHFSNFVSENEASI